MSSYSRLSAAEQLSSRASTVSVSTFANTLRMYNETLRDLLVSDVASPKKLDLQHDSQGGVRVTNLSVFDLSTASHGLSLVEAGCRARSVGVAPLLPAI